MAGGCAQGASAAVIRYVHFPVCRETAKRQLRLLELACGHREGCYVAVERVRPTRLKPRNLWPMMRSGRVLYIGSSTNLSTRVGQAIRSVQERVSPGHEHSLGWTFRSRASQAGLGWGDVSLLVMGCGSGFSLEDFLLRQHMHLGSWPRGNSRPATRPGTNVRRPYVRFCWQDLDAAELVSSSPPSGVLKGAA